MLPTYPAVLSGNRLVWSGEAPPGLDSASIPVHVTLLTAPPVGRPIAEAGIVRPFSAAQSAWRFVAAFCCAPVSRIVNITAAATRAMAACRRQPWFVIEGVPRLGILPIESRR